LQPHKRIVTVIKCRPAILGSISTIAWLDVAGIVKLLSPQAY